MLRLHSSHLLPIPVRSRSKALLAAAVLALCGCRMATQDQQDCVEYARHQAQDAEGPTFSQSVTQCMADRGWRPVHPHRPPGSNAWVRVRP